MRVVVKASLPNVAPAIENIKYESFPLPFFGYLSFIETKLRYSEYVLRTRTRVVNNINTCMKCPSRLHPYVKSKLLARDFKTTLVIFKFVYLYISHINSNITIRFLKSSFSLQNIIPFSETRQTILSSNPCC